MIDYKLAKQLKEAGFLQKGKSGEHWAKGYQGGKRTTFIACSMMCGSKDECYTPSLSELIDACGMEFWILENLNNGMWVAKAIDREGKEILIKSKTPKEAAAKLYIKLNK